MKIPRYWKSAEGSVPGTKGSPYLFSAWGWSADSVEEALARAQASVRRIADRLTAGQGFPDSYEYFDRPPREEIMEEIRDAEGETVAMLTRNHYGSIVLNTSRMMIIDVDAPAAAGAAGLAGLVKRLFGSASPTPAEQARERISAAARSRPELAFRVYQTLAGFRVIVTSKRIAPGSEESSALFDAFGADPLYVKLCKNQESFRARLTPKPWRCGLAAPPLRFPFETERAEAIYKDWVRKYEAACSRFSACEFLEQIGAAPGVGEFRPLIDLHDRIAISSGNDKLA